MSEPTEGGAAHRPAGPGLDRPAGAATPGRRGRRLPRSFYRRDSRVVAPELLNKVLVHGVAAGRIVEVEAYCGGEDPGSHAYRGPTRRNVTMFGPAGGLYVYFTYGMHWCANAVCGDEGQAVAVLIRALEPTRGIDEMRARRPAARRDQDLASGPARLCQALGIDGTFDGADLVSAERGVTIVDDGVPPPPDPGISARIGLSAGAELPWRWYVASNRHVSRVPAARRPRSRGAIPGLSRPITTASTA